MLTTKASDPPIQAQLAFELLFTAKVNQLIAYRRVPILLELPDCEITNDRWLEAAASISHYKGLELFGRVYQWDFNQGLQIREVVLEPEPVYAKGELWFEA